MQWTDLRLGDAVEIRHGYAFEGALFTDMLGYPTLVTPGNFDIGGGWKDAKPKTYSGEPPDGYVLEPGALLVTMTDLSRATDTLGLPAIVPADGRTYLHNQRIGKVLVTDPTRVQLEFLGYYLRVAHYRQYVVGSATGSTVKHTSPSRILDFVARVPPISAQQAIAEVLGALDDKIAANERIVLLADELMRCRYAALPGDSRVLGEVAAQVRDQLAPDAVDPQTKYVGLEHLPRRRAWAADSGRAADVTSAKSSFLPKDVLFGKLRPYFHKVVSAGTPGICSTDILVIRAKDSRLSGLILAAVSSDETIARVSAATEGTRMPRTNWKDLSATSVRWPSEEKARNFSVEVQDLSESMHQVVAESAQLARTRDELLPLLMSGKLRVQDVEKTVEDLL